MQRLVANHFCFTESPRIKANYTVVQHDANKLRLFMESTGYILLDATMSITSTELYEVYTIWREEAPSLDLSRKANAALEGLSAPLRGWGTGARYALCA